jgi:hypothetical protein
MIFTQAEHDEMKLHAELEYSDIKENFQNLYLGDRVEVPNANRRTNQQQFSPDQSGTDSGLQRIYGAGAGSQDYGEPAESGATGGV